MDAYEVENSGSPLGGFFAMLKSRTGGLDQYAEILSKRWKVPNLSQDNIQKRAIGEIIDPKDVEEVISDPVCVWVSRRSLCLVIETKDQAFSLRSIDIMSTADSLLKAGLNFKKIRDCS